MNGDSQAFRSVAPTPGPRDSRDPVPGPDAFLSREELRLPARTAGILAAVVLVPFLAILAWLVFGALAASGQAGP